MPKLPIVKDRQLIKLLKKLGFIERAESGTSHLILKHGDGRITIVPRHPGKDIPRGTLRGIINDIDVTVEDFVRFLKMKLIRVFTLFTS